MQNRNTHTYGWIIVGSSFITLSFAYGVMYSFSVFFVALLKEFNWNRALCAGAYSVFHVTGKRLCEGEPVDVILAISRKEEG